MDLRNLGSSGWLCHWINFIWDEINLFQNFGDLKFVLEFWSLRFCSRISFALKRIQKAGSGRKPAAQ